MINLILHLLGMPFRSRRSLILENIALRHQLQVLGRRKQRPPLRNRDRAVWILLRRFWFDWQGSLVMVRPETVIGWHRRGFRAFWTRKSCKGQQGKPQLWRETRKLIRQMAHDNPTWGAPRIRGELLKLGIELSSTTVAKYMKRTGPPSQSWKTFLENHANEIVSVDFFTVPTSPAKCFMSF